ncbi:hypothetical protein SELMODRAFT_422671 [Selaginella moellendorffii]|uniref:Uncharacterized protein n=1 Tax=Selaginella moellendorffii TaxID=88036 RepID=D8SJ62_SELML|nr:hypothetical protein SELMODRAFT_422671 [Selaginella moellendorffii]
MNHLYPVINLALYYLLLRRNARKPNQMSLNQSRISKCMESWIVQLMNPAINFSPFYPFDSKKTGSDEREAENNEERMQHNDTDSVKCQSLHSTSAFTTAESTRLKSLRIPIAFISWRIRGTRVRDSSIYRAADQHAGAMGITMHGDVK